MKQEMSPCKFVVYKSTKRTENTHETRALSLWGYGTFPFRSGWKCVMHAGHWCVKSPPPLSCAVKPLI